MTGRATRGCARSNWIAVAVYAAQGRGRCGPGDRLHPAGHRDLPVRTAGHPARGPGHTLQPGVPDPSLSDTKGHQGVALAEKDMI